MSDEILRKAMNDGPKVMSRTMNIPYATAAHYRYLWKRNLLSDSQANRIIGVYQHVK